MNSGDKTVDALEIDVRRLEHQHKNDECACKLLSSALDDAKAETERLTRELAEQSAEFECWKDDSAADRLVLRQELAKYESAEGEK